MNKKIRLFIILFFLICFANLSKSLALDLKIPKTDDEWDKAIASLNWVEGPKNLNFNDANSKINISNRFTILEGADANQWLYWSNGIEFPEIKIYAIDEIEGSQYMFSYVDSGYVKTDDWTNVDPKEFLKEITENYKASNSERENSGMPIVVDVKWKKKPFLDNNYSSVYYALEIGWSDNQNTTQATALILGRDGYTSAQYVAGKNGYQETMLTNLSKIHTFNATKQYKDWKSGDKVAALGIGALLASTLGIKSLKPALFTTIMLLIKKLWFLIFLPFIFIGKLFTGSSKKK